MGLLSEIRSGILDSLSTSNSVIDNQVNGGEDESKLIDKFESWWKEAGTLQDNRMKWIKPNRALYLGDHIKGSRPAYRSRTIHNKIFENVDSFKSKMVKGLPDPVSSVNSDEQIDIDYGRTVTNALKHLNRVDRTRQKLKLVAINMLTDRDAIVLMRWDPKKGKEGDITWEIVEPENFRIDPNATDEDQGSYFFIAPPRSYRYVLERYPQFREHILKSFGITEQDIAEHKKKDKLLPLKEVWYWQEEGQSGVFNIYTATYLKDKLLYKGKNPYWDFVGELLNPEDKVEFTKRVEDIKQVAVLRGEDVAKEQLKQLQAEFDGKKRYRNFLEKQEFPYIKFQTFPSNDMPYSNTSPVEQVASLQISLNERKQEIDENAKLVGKGIWIKDKNSGISDNQIVSSAGAVYTKNAGTEVRREPGIPLPQQFFDDMRDSEKAIDNVFGSNDISKGQVTNANQPVRTSIILKEADEGRVGSITELFYESLEKLYQWQVHLMNLYYTKPRTITVANAMGNIESYTKIVNDNIQDNLQITIEHGPQQPNDDNTKRQEAVELFKSGMIDSVTFFQRYGGFEDPYKQAKMLDEYTKGTLFTPPDIGPEQRARQSLDALLRGEKIQPDQEATKQSIQILAEALGDTARYPFTADQLAKLEEKIQLEQEIISGKREQSVRDQRIAETAPDIAAEFEDVPDAQDALELAAQQQ